MSAHSETIADAAPSAPLSIPVFRAVWIASMASNFGGLIQSVGASWLMTSLTPSSQMVALVQASTALPILLLSLWSGAVADNLDRKQVMLGAQAFMLLVSISLAIVTYVGWITPWVLLVFTFLIGCGAAMNGPAWQASVGDMVPRAALPGAVALNSMGFNIARSVGPAIGGAIVAVAGAAVAFVVNALSYVGLIAVLARWKPARRERVLPRETLGHAMIAGIRYVRLSPDIRTVLLRALLFGFGASAVPAMMPLVARDVIVGNSLTYGVLLGAFGIGAVVGGLLVRWLRARMTVETIVRAAAAALVIGSAVTGLSDTMWLTIPALALAGGGWVLALSTFNVTVQLSAPRWVVARALSLYQMAAFGGLASGAILFGAVADAQGVQVALLIAAPVQALTILAGFVFPLPAARDLNLALREWEEPETAVSVDERSGPIVVTIEYRIAPGDIPRFLNVMHERRRIRRRDGARHWTLLRDLGEPESWVERYHVATWLDYVRHNQRRTYDDAQNTRDIVALHIGPAKPVVHRMIERQTSTLPGMRDTSPRELADPMTDTARQS
ncbi:MFS transporter [Sphingomonas sp. AX6]|uniref:MFS transporter n=1 Tax=Sphingomonas sp. AX6 TaxID=2653171 RepID=UPI0012EFE0FE|nr:MFS transporter [Sphingomonas sp. AX6]VXC78708.1 ABC transporter permease [Sphingomonas sp. AX6]